MTDESSINRSADGQVKEQLSLFIPYDARELEQRSIPRTDWGGNRREKLAELLSGDLNFHREDSGYASHDLHAFAAKFPPQLPRVFIESLTAPGDVVLDPMMGSGTTVVEAFLRGRRAVGFDIDPLAVRICRVKTTPLDVEKLSILGAELLAQAHQLLADPQTITQALANRFDVKTRDFVNYWFLPTTQQELMALILAIGAMPNGSRRDFFELAFSSIIVTKSGGVSMARDLAHSRPHLDKTKVPRNALEQFEQRLSKNLSSIAQLQGGKGTAHVHRGDARSLPLADQSVDLIVTSPPYANAIDYVRAHKFSLVWFGERIKDLSELRATYIGSERIAGLGYVALPYRAEAMVQRLSASDKKKAAVLRKYFSEMREAIAEMYRVLRPDSVAIVVVGTSTMRGINVETHLCLADIAAAVGFDVVGVPARQLDRNRRMMPARFGRKSDSMIEQRMHEEYVIGLWKSSC